MDKTLNFNDGPTFTINYGASFIPHNLSCENQRIRKSDKSTVNTRIGVAHRNIFQIYGVTGEWIEGINFKHEQNIQFSPPKNILSADWMALTVNDKPRSVLVITSEDDVSFYNENGTFLIYKHVWNKSTDGFSRVFTCQGSTIYMANNKGDVLEFVYKISRQDEIEFSKRTDGMHLFPIYCIAIIPEMLATGDINGNLCLWRLVGLSKLNEFKTETEQTVTNCLFWSHYVVGSYSSGAVRIYDYKKNRLHAKIDAHYHWICNMEISLMKNLLMTVSEDSVCRLWKISESKSLTQKLCPCCTNDEQPQLKITRKDDKRFMSKQVNFKGQIAPHSCHAEGSDDIVGAKFLNSDGSVIALTFSGSKGISLYGK